VVESAEGNPLFVEQFSAMVAGSGELVVPPSIQGLLKEGVPEVFLSLGGTSDRVLRRSASGG
jgi:hypothetical protein